MSGFGLESGWAFARRSSFTCLWTAPFLLLFGPDSFFDARFFGAVDFAVVIFSHARQPLLVKARELGHAGGAGEARRGRYRLRYRELGCAENSPSPRFLRVSRAIFLHG